MADIIIITESNVRVSHLIADKVLEALDGKS